MKNQIIYWVTTGIIGLMMLYSAFSYLTNPEMEGAFKQLGFPGYFRIELAVAKVIGAIVLVIPQIPVRIKEWAYAGFGIVFISASMAHINNGDPIAIILTPLVFLAILIISYMYTHKLRSRPERT